ncbi:SafA/ExsA family spore coat assembly protein [Bacillus cytotoxicus]|uniref:SafA/ExsA family spore coat assembly protein n=1 Tax=Bacillus cytotoxicus TaxID=580165 RepID=UPI0024483CF6|nr:SafA/ExsA family spore coat assembly protein [Bacillus cytotoxicus]MDH2922487.1 SafA/ExsA family spore coat assembly protein [Bacillus cytotoxicus]
MKIHIVQKGDTLWKIAKKYGVDLETLKIANTQLSNPDLIMPGMKIKVPSGSVHVKKNAGAGSVPPKEYVKEVQQKEFAATPTPLTIEEEEEITYESAPITQQPAMQQTQKEMQIKPQKEAPIQKEAAIQKEKSIEKPVVIEKPPVIEEKGQKAAKESTKFSINILPQPPQPPIKPAKEYKISDIIKKGSELITPQIHKVKPNHMKAPQVKKENAENIAAPQVKKENAENIAAPQVKKENMGNIAAPQVKKENMGNIASPNVAKDKKVIPQILPPTITMPIMDNIQPPIMPMMENNPMPNIMPMTENNPMPNIMPMAENNPMPNIMPMAENNPMPNIMPMTENSPMPNIMPMMENNQPPNIMSQPMPYHPQLMPQQHPYQQYQNLHYNMSYPQFTPIAPQYTSMPMENNMPPSMSEEEDCGCDEGRILYSPQPGEPQSASPLYYQPHQTAYAPQPGTMYYQPDPPDMFGSPIEEEE